MAPPGRDVAQARGHRWLGEIVAAAAATLEGNRVEAEEAPRRSHGPALRCACACHSAASK